MSYQDRFSGVGRLYGMGALERLRAAHVMVVGVGGVGSWTVEALARTGIGKMTLVDLDDVCITNTNRQLPAIEGEIGRPKATVLEERIRRINPDLEVESAIEFFTAATADRLLLLKPDVVIDAIDSMSNKTLLISECVKRSLRCITVGGAGGKRDGTLVRVADLGECTIDHLLRIVRKKLRREHGFEHGENVCFGVRCVYSLEHPTYSWSNGTCSAEPEPNAENRLNCDTGFGTAAFVTAAFGFAAAGEAVRLIVAKQ